MATQQTIDIYIHDPADQSGDTRAWRAAGAWVPIVLWLFFHVARHSVR
jgi:hypothetical protein